MEELRFGITLDDRPARVQEMGGRDFTVIGAVSSYEEIGVDAEGKLFLLDPTPSTPSLLNTSMDGFRGFVKAFEEFYGGSPASAPSPDSVEDAEEVKARRRRLRRLKKHLNAVDPDAVAKDLYWCVIVEQIEDGLL
jgi:hypothetical protein